MNVAVTHNDVIENFELEQLSCTKQVGRHTNVGLQWRSIASSQI